MRGQLDARLLMIKGARVCVAEPNRSWLVIDGCCELAGCNGQNAEIPGWVRVSSGLKVSKL